MQSFYEFCLLKETPDKCNGTPWAVADSIAFGIIKDVGLSIRQRTHVNLYNDLYLAFITKKLQTEPEIKHELGALGVTVAGNVSSIRPLVLSKIREVPWSVVNNMAMADEAAEILRDEFFNVAGRIWTNKKICSFWNMQRTVQSYLPQLKKVFESYYEHIEDFKFEFIERQGKFLTWWEVSGQPAPVSAKEQEEANKLLRLQHNSPEIKKAVANKGGGANKLASFAQSMGFRNPIEWQNAVTVGD